MKPDTPIANLHRGAAFYRADLHIHSYGASHDVKDLAATPDGILTQAAAVGLDLIAITDHNSISNVRVALEAAAAQSSSVLVIPGVELSTPQGHLLAYLPTLRSLEKFYNQLDIADPGSPESRCGQGMYECLNLLQQLGGFAVLAHVDGAKGYEETTPGMSPHKLDVICHSALVAIELTSAASELRYHEGDPDPERVRAGRERVARLQLGVKQCLARVLFSDAHSLASLGRNALGSKRLTRIKMDRPSFDALRIALEDADARVRLEDEIPTSVPHVVGIEFNGGFLDGQAIHLSPNLNCIIGGRGTGKSMTFEAVRCLTGREGSDVVDSEVWPPAITLQWRDAAGSLHRVQKLVGEELIHLDDPDFGPNTFPLESYGQGDTAKLSERAQSDPMALLKYLDQFIDLDEAIITETRLRDELLTLQSTIEEAELKVARIPDYERYLATTRKQLDVLNREKASDVIVLQRGLAAERQLRERITEDWRDISSSLLNSEARTRLAQLRSLADPSSLHLGKPEYTAISDALLRLTTTIDVAGESLSTEATAFSGVLANQLRSWRAKETEALKKIEEKRRALEAQGIRLDMAYIQKLTNDEALYVKNLDALRTWKRPLQEAARQRRKVLRERWLARERVANLRDAYARGASETLRSVLTDLDVSIKIVRNALAPEATVQIQQVMGWRTNQVPRATLLTQTLTVPLLLEAVEKQDARTITNLAYADGTKPFNLADARDLLQKLREPKVKAALERAEIHDLPRIQVTKRIDAPGAAPRYITREFSRLSLGQQQSVLLSLLLSSGGTDPLIIDQPEDNLDGEFIYSSFVPVLRRAKERRQIIVVTHNANIAVLGDAELIVVLKSHNDRGIVTSRGSIDDPETRRAACNILEGAEEAFIRRARIYGIPRRLNQA